MGNSLFDIIKSLVDLKDERERNETAIELQEQIFRLLESRDRERELRLSAESRAETLEKKLMELREFDAVAKLYEVLTPRHGITVYKRREPPKEWGEQKWYCPECFADGRISILQDETPRPARSLDAQIKCFKCGFGFSLLRRVFLEMVKL